MSTNENQEYTMTDETIAQIAKVLQVAILTGTDIVDNLRMAKFVATGDKIEVSPNYAENFNNQLETLLAEVSQQPTSAVFDT